MMNHMKNGLIVARFLEKHPAVKGVLHPGSNFFYFKTKENILKSFIFFFIHRTFIPSAT